MPALLKSTKTADQLGREIIFAIHKKNLNKVRELLAGANVNYIDPENNDTQLHYVFFYNFCNSEIVRLLLNADADPGIKNAEGLTAYSLAEKRCSTNWPLLKSIFDSFIPTTHSTEKLKSVPVDNFMLNTPLASSTKMLILPVSALFNGSLALGMDKFAEWSEEYAYYLPYFIRYVLKLMALAGVSASE